MQTDRQTGDRETDSRTLQTERKGERETGGKQRTDRGRIQEADRQTDKTRHAYTDTWSCCFRTFYDWSLRNRVVSAKVSQRSEVVWLLVCAVDN